MSSKRFLTILAVAATLSVAACGDDHSVDAVGAAPKSSMKAAHPKQPATVDNDLVKAASPSKVGAAMDMKFKIVGRPQAGKPVALTLVFEPPPDDVDRMTVSLSASEGLSIESGEGPATFVPSHGAPISHEMSVRADHDGIFLVTASVLVDALNNSESSRSFSVPIIVGEGIEAVTVAKASGAKAP